MDSQTSFGVQSTATPEARIAQPDSHGRPVRQPGKVDAYRYMTFYLEPAATTTTRSSGRWSTRSGCSRAATPPRAALRRAQQAGKRPPCWRVLHRVTYVSRVLPVLRATSRRRARRSSRRCQKLDMDSRTTS